MEGNRCHVQSINKTRGDRSTSVCVPASRSCAKALFMYMIALPLVNNNWNFTLDHHKEW